MKGLEKILQAFRDKRLRYGTFSTLTAILVIAVLVTVNLIAGQLDISYDLTQDKFYSLSVDSKEALAELEGDVVIYWLYKTGMTDFYTDAFRSLLEEYPRISSRIRLEYKDPYLYPQFIEGYRGEGEDIPVGSVIVEGSERFRVIPVTDLVSQEIDYQTFQTYISSINLEPQVTNAIRYVLSGETPVVYVLGGHGEAELPESFIKRLEMGNYELRDLNLFDGEVPEDCDLLFVTTPQRDWNTEEAKSVTGYLENGGRGVFFIDFTSSEYPNMESVLAAYGVELLDGLVFEGNPANYFQGNPVNLVPGFAQHEIIQPIYEKGYPMLMPVSRAVVESELKKQSTAILPLLVTSNNSYGKTNLNSQSIDKEPGDIDGPFMLAAAVEDGDTKLVITGGTSVLNESINENFVMGTNYDYILNCMNWTQDSADNIYISPKSAMSTQSLVMNSGQAFMIIGMSLLIPLIIIAFGLTVWFRRRSS